MDLNATIQFLLNATLADNSITGFTTSSTTRFGLDDDQNPVSIGTAASMATKMYRSQKSMTAGEIQTLDLRALPFPNDPSATPDTVQVLNRVVAVIVKIPTGSSAKLRLGGAALNAWEAFTSVAGSKWDVADFDFKLDRTITGFVVDATHKDLKIENVGSTGEVIVVILGD